MSPDHLRLVAWILGLVTAILAASAAGAWLTRRMLERWARTQGCHVVEFHGAPFWRGPRAWRRMDYQEDYRVVVGDAAGRRRSGWVLFTSRWYGLGPQDVEVRWDEIAPGAL
jgi:hypothetical protein